MTYAPCFNCAADKSTCPRREGVRKGIAGLGVTSVKFKCTTRVPRFHVGQRVEFDWRYFDEDGRGDGYTATFNGTVMREKTGNKRFSIRVDQDGEYYDLKPADIFKSPEFISVRPDDMRALDEPNRPLCPNCAAYDDADDIKRLCWGGGDNLAKGCFS